MDQTTSKSCPRQKRWRCRSDGKHGRQDDKAVLSPTLPTALGNRQRTAVPTSPPHDDDEGRKGSKLTVLLGRSRDNSTWQQHCLEEQSETARSCAKPKRRGTSLLDGIVRRRIGLGTDHSQRFASVFAVASRGSDIAGRQKCVRRADAPSETHSVDGLGRERGGAFGRFPRLFRDAKRLFVSRPCLHFLNVNLRCPSRSPRQSRLVIQSRRRKASGKIQRPWGEG